MYVSVAVGVVDSDVMFILILRIMTPCSLLVVLVTLQRDVERC